MYTYYNMRLKFVIYSISNKILTSTIPSTSITSMQLMIYWIVESVRS